MDNTTFTDEEKVKDQQHLQNQLREEKMSKLKGGFTLPGEAGYEALTLKMADKWGADVIRDSDGTVLSDDILKAGYGIYSTIRIIRDHNEWAKAHPDQLQQTFLMTSPEIASTDTLEVEIMKEFFDEQFQVNTTDASMKYWQVYDRTVNEEVPRGKWSYNKATQVVTISGVEPFHTYAGQLSGVSYLGRDFYVQSYHE